MSSNFYGRNFQKTLFCVRKKARNGMRFFCVVDKAKIGLKESGDVEIVNLKLDPQDVLAFVDNKTIFKAWHMNKKHWISALLQGKTLPIKQLYQFLDESYALA